MHVATGTLPTAEMAAAAGMVSAAVIEGGGPSVVTTGTTMAAAVAATAVAAEGGNKYYGCAGHGCLLKHGHCYWNGSTGAVEWLMPCFLLVGTWN